jgi:DNA-binding transcriptional ArsR family regulator
VIEIKPDRKEEIKKMLCSCDDSINSNLIFHNLQEIGDQLKSNENIANLAIFMSALASKERIIIIKNLINNDRCVCELETILDKSQSTISHHLKKLENIGLIKGWKKGNFTYYGLEREKFNFYLKILTEELS